MATTTKKTKSGESSKPPAAKLRIGLLSASIWERSVENGAFYSVTFERRYRDGKGEWHSTHSFDKSNLLTLAKLADQADSEIIRLLAHRDQAA